MNAYNVREFAHLVGVSVKTLQRWDREGRLVAGRTITNRRVYTDEDLAKALGRVHIPEDNRDVVAYVRVSTRAQKPDMANQRTALEAYCLEHGHSVTLWLEDYGSGLNFKRRNLRKLITMIITGRIRQVIVAHKDRLARFGFDLVDYLCQIHDCELLVVNGEELSPEQELVQDVLAILHVFSARLYGLRSYRQKIREALESDAKSTQDTTEPNA